MKANKDGNDNAKVATATNMGEENEITPHNE